jgi:hypothetical protein
MRPLDSLKSFKNFRSFTLLPNINKTLKSKFYDGGKALKELKLLKGARMKGMS